MFEAWERPATGWYGLVWDAKRSGIDVFDIGTMVWARVGESDWWPGRISSIESAIEREGATYKYVVTYYPPFSRHSRAIPKENIELYTESDDEHFKKRCSRLSQYKLFNETVATAHKVYEQKALHESCQQAAVEGDLDRLKQLIPELYSVVLLGGHTEDDYPSLSYLAARNGQLESLKFLCEYNVPGHEAEGGHFIVTPHFIDAVEMGIVDGFCRSWGKIETDEFVHSLEGWAAEGGHLACLEYLVRRNRGSESQSLPPPPCDVCYIAAINGHVECLRYAHQNGFPWDSNGRDQNCFDAAIIGGNLDCVKYCRDNNCAWDRDTYNYAVESLEQDGETDIFECLAEMFRGRGIDTSKHYVTRQHLKRQDAARNAARARGNSRRTAMRQKCQEVQALLDENARKIQEGDYMSAAKAMLEIHNLTKKADDEE